MRKIVVLGKMVVLGIIAWSMAASAALALQSDKETSFVLLAQARFKEFKPLPGEQVIQGQISKIEKEAYVIKDADGKEVRLKVTEQTILREDFKPGDRVQAHVNESGVASVIKYMPVDKKEQQTQRPQRGVMEQGELSPESKTAQLLPGHRVVTGTVEEVKADMARVRVDTGDLTTRPLSLKQGQEKGIHSLKEGDRVELIINSENGLVDYHREGHPGVHRVLRGRVAEIAEGVEWAEIIGENGDKARYPVQSEARSRIKKVYTGAPALFLIGEANNVLDAVAENTTEIQLPAKKEPEKNKELDKKSSDPGKQGQR
jgi:exosome complex RNA-binding protein Csl4